MKKLDKTTYRIEITNKDGAVCSKYKVELKDTDNKNEILNTFFKQYPKYRSSNFLTQLKVMDSCKIKDYSDNPEPDWVNEDTPEYAGIYGEDLEVIYVNKIAKVLNIPTYEVEIYDTNYKHGEALTTLYAYVPINYSIEQIESKIDSIKDISVDDIAIDPEYSNDEVNHFEITIAYEYEFWDEEEFLEDYYNKDKFTEYDE